MSTAIYAGPRTLVATDGSHTGGQYGYAYAVDENVYGYGPLDPGENTELVAVRRALQALSGPLLVVVDEDAVYEFLALGREPKRGARHGDEYRAARAEVMRRDVRFLLRNGDTGPAEHALAHYLAFLGRRGGVPTVGQPAPGAGVILLAEAPYEAAAALVRDTLFPTLARGGSR